MKFNPKIVTFLSILLGFACRIEATFRIDLDPIDCNESKCPACEITKRGDGKATVECYMDAGHDVTDLKYHGVYKSEGGECEDESNVDVKEKDAFNEGTRKGSFEFEIIFSPKGNEEQSNILESYSSTEGNIVQGCVKVEAMGEDQDNKEIVMNAAYIRIKVEVDDDGEFSIDELAQEEVGKMSGTFLTDQSISSSGDGNVEAKQCKEGEKIGLGDQVCLKITLDTADAVGEMDHIESCKFFKEKNGNANEEWESIGFASTTADDGENGNFCEADECDLKTYLPQFFYDDDKKIWVEGTVIVRAPSDSRRLRGGDRRLDHEEKEHFKAEIQFEAVADNSAAATSNFKLLITSLVFFGGMAVYYL